MWPAVVVLALGLPGARGDCGTSMCTAKDKLCTELIADDETTCADIVQMCGTDCVSCDCTDSVETCIGNVGFADEQPQLCGASACASQLFQAYGNCDSAPITVQSSACCAGKCGNLCVAQHGGTQVTTSCRHHLETGKSCPGLVGECPSCGPCCSNWMSPYCGAACTTAEGGPGTCQSHIENGMTCADLTSECPGMCDACC